MNTLPQPYLLDRLATIENPAYRGPLNRLISTIAIPLDLRGQSMIANSLFVPVASSGGFPCRAALYRQTIGYAGPARTPTAGGGQQALAKIPGTEGLSQFITGGTRPVVKVFEQPVKMTPASRWYIVIFTGADANMLFYLPTSDYLNAGVINYTWEGSLPIPLAFQFTAGSTDGLPDRGIVTRAADSATAPTNSTPAPLAVLFSRQGAYQFLPSSSHHP